MTRPDFVMIGAMKCGTTTMAAQLGLQSGIFMTDPKEPNYFSDDAIFAQGDEWYSALFADAAPDDLKGEASTHYTKCPDLPHTVERMHAALGEDLRLIYMIRDPIERLLSHYVHGWSRREITVPLDDALEKHPELVEYGRYGMQIAPYVETWGREAICLSSLERMRAEPNAELSRIARHIGHRALVSWQADREAENRGAARVRRFPLHGLLVENPVADALRRTLVPKSVRQWVRDKRRVDQRPVIPAAALPGLRARFAEDRQTLAGFFPGDPSLSLAYPWLEE